MQSYIDQAYRTFSEAVADALNNKEFFLVEPASAENTIQLATATSTTVGVMFRKIQSGHPDVTVRLLGKGGTVKVKQGAATPKGSFLKWGTGAKVIAAAAGERSIGRKLTQGSGADGDIIEMLDLSELAPFIEGILTMGGGAASEAEEVLGVLSTDGVLASIVDNGSNDNVILLEAKPTADTITFLFNEDPTAGVKVAYRIIR